MSARAPEPSYEAAARGWQQRAIRAEEARDVAQAGRNIFVERARRAEAAISSVRSRLASLAEEIGWQREKYGDGSDLRAMGRLIGMQDAYRAIAEALKDAPKEPAAVQDWAWPAQPAYDAVYAYIRSLGDSLPPTPVHRNAAIWRGVDAALKALAPAAALDSSGTVEDAPGGIDGNA